MMKKGSFFSRFLACILTSFFALIFLTLFFIVLFRSMITYDNVSEYVKNSRVFDSESYEILSRGSSKTLRSSIQQDLLEIGISYEVTNEVLDSEEINTILSTYIYDYYRYVLYDDTKSTFPDDQLISIVESKYLTKNGITLTSDQKVKLIEKVRVIGDKLDKGLFNDLEVSSMYDLNTVKIGVKLLDSNYVLILLVLVLLILLLLIALCLKSFVWACRWCSKVIVVDGVILVITSLLEVKLLSMFFNSKGIVDNLVISLIQNGFMGLLIGGITLIVVGILLILISGILLKREKKKNMKKEEKSIILKSNAYASMFNQNKVEEKPDESSENEVSKSVDNSETKTDDNIEAEETAVANVSDTNEVDDGAVDLEIEVSDSDDTAIEQSESDISKIDSDISIVEPDVSQDDLVIDEDESSSDEVVMEIVEDIDEDSNIEENNASEEYTEISDVEDVIEKEEVSIKSIDEIQPELVHPEKGKDIDVNLQDDEDDEIEVL